MIEQPNHRITLYPAPHSFQGEKGVGFHLKRKGEGKESSLPN